MRTLLICILLLFIPGSTFANDDEYLFTELTKIAESGNPEAQYHLGMLFNNGIGTDKDIGQAFFWFEKSASAGNPLGHYKVGCYYSGQGEGVVAADRKKALEHKLIAAESGYVRAQYDVASTYYQNNEIDNAISWWEKAAHQGYPDAVFALFAVYSEGKGISQDLAKAYGYLKIIEKNAEKENMSKIEEKEKELRIKLSPQQVLQAENFAKAWSPKKSDLTIKAFAGIEESRRIIQSSKENRTVTKPDRPT